MRKLFDQQSWILFLRFISIFHLLHLSLYCQFASARQELFERLVQSVHRQTLAYNNYLCRSQPSPSVDQEESNLQNPFQRLRHSILRQSSCNPPSLLLSPVLLVPCTNLPCETEASSQPLQRNVWTAKSAVLPASTVPLLYTMRVGLAGGLAGAFGTAVLYPLDAAKTLRQSRPTEFSNVAAALKSLLFSSSSSQRFTLPATTERQALVFTSSLPRLNLGRVYAGVWTATIGALPSSALYFGAYETFKTMIQRNYGWQHEDGVYSRLSVHALAAASGNIVSSAVFVPKELIKQRMQYTGSSSIRRTIVSVLKDRGLSGLYCGYKATLMRNVPSAMLRFVLYEELKWRWVTNQQSKAISDDLLDPDRYHRPLFSWKFLAAGAVAGALASGFMTPIDVLKTRFSTGTCPVDVRQCFAHIFAEQGWSGIYAGAGSRMALSGAYSALGFWSFEAAKAWLGVSQPPPKLTTHDLQSQPLVVTKRKVMTLLPPKMSQNNYYTDKN